MQSHMCTNRILASHARKVWQDKEVAQVWQASQEANCAYRRTVKAKDSEDWDKWHHYLKLKHKMQALVQINLANDNRTVLLDLQDKEKSTASKFWCYVQSLDGKDC